MHKLMKTAMMAVALFLGAAGISQSAQASGVNVADAATEWVEVTRYIPVYVDGVLVGYVVHTTWVWRNDSRQEQ